MTETSSARERLIWPWIAGAIVIAVLVVGFLLVRDLIAFGRPAPEFPSLADAPDQSLHGTVAYFAMDEAGKTQVNSGCVRVVAAAGAPSRDVLCLTDEGDDTGPELAFLPDGRLQVTMYSWPTGQDLVVSWRKVVDLRTGETEEVSIVGLQATPAELGPTVSATGERIATEVRNNQAELVLTGADGASRSLWTAEVSPDYSIAAIWAPDGEWVLAYDGRLLVVNPEDPVRIRMLVAQPGVLGSPGSTSPRMYVFAVTGADLLEVAG
jgi:hypothetical protein